MNNHTKLILETFFNRLDCFGLYICNFSEKYYGQKAKALTQKQEITEKIIADFLAHNISIGAHSNDPQGKGKWLCLDFDIHKEIKQSFLQNQDSVSFKNAKKQARERVKLAEKKLKKMNIPYILEDSVGGYHIWIFMDQATEIEYLHTLGKHLVSEDVEIFPKQKNSSDKSYGNFVRLPGVYHSVGTDGKKFYSNICINGEWLPLFDNFNLVHFAEVERFSKQICEELCRDIWKSQLCKASKDVGNLGYSIKEDDIAEVIDALKNTPGVCDTNEQFESLMFACKGCSISYENFDSICRNSHNYNEKENRARWNSVKTSNYTKKTLYYLLKQADENKFRELVHNQKYKNVSLPEQDPEVQKNLANSNVIKEFVVSKKLRYLVTEDGVYKECIGENRTHVIQVLSQGVYIKEILREMSSGDRSVALVWDNREATFTQDTVCFTKGISQLALKGINVHHLNQKLAIDYFQRAISLTKNEKKCSERNGWISNNSFVLGNKLIHKNGKVEEIQFKAVNYIPQTKGDIAIWKHCLAEFADDWQIALRLGSSVISPFLQRLGCANYTSHLWGGSGRSKTTSSNLAASIWGSPTKLLEDWKASSAGQETVFEEAGGLPVFFEESHKANPVRVTEAIYNFANKKASAKARVDNSGKRKRRESPNFLGVILSTGEHKITDFTNDTGAVSRLIEIHKNKVSRDGWANKVERINADLEDNYGFLGEDIVKHFFQHEDSLKEYFESIKDWIKQNAQSIVYRQAQYYASSLVGLHILRELGVSVASEEDILYKGIVEQKEVHESLEDKVVGYLSSVVSSNETHFYCKEDVYNKYTAPTSYECWGRYNSQDNTVDFFPHILEKLLLEGNFLVSGIIACLKECQRLIHDLDAKTRRIKIKGAKKKVYSIRLDST